MTTIKDVLETEIQKQMATITAALDKRDKAIVAAREAYTDQIQESKASIKAMKEMIDLFNEHNEVFNSIQVIEQKEV